MAVLVMRTPESLARPGGAGRHVGGRLGRDGLPATGTITLVQVDPRRVRFDWWQFDMVVGVRKHLTVRRYLPTAVAALGKDVACDIGVRTDLTRKN